ncbi:hypothetical protein [Brumimicrobium oceani]|uniref:hypothetical protein n=1 Tax=Brumimicrobium oceani TaxID=2100725 RepID=UPI001304E836|nr:hypothetical protein [Brumimicrobium oceani]
MYGNPRPREASLIFVAAWEYLKVYAEAKVYSEDYELSTESIENTIKEIIEP